MFTSREVLSVGAMFLAGSLLANAQEPGVKVQVQPKQGVQVQVQPRVAAAANRTDFEIAQMLIHCDETEVAISRAVAAKVKNAEVKKFAEKMVEAHSSAMKELQKYAQAQPQAAPVQPQANPNQPQPRPQATPNNQPDGPRAAQPRHLDLVTLSAEMRDECISAAKDEIEKKEGRELDACYVGMQIAAHQGALTKIKVLKRHASAELQNDLDDRAKVVEEHLTHAKDLMKQIDSKTPKTAQND